MTPGEIARGVGLGLLVWFSWALYFGVLVEAALPARAVNALVLKVAIPLVWWISGRVSLLSSPPSPNLP